MPRRKESKPLQKVTIALYRGDMAWLQSTYREEGASRVIRLLVEAHRKRIEAAAPPQPKLEVTL